MTDAHNADVENSILSKITAARADLRVAEMALECHFDRMAEKDPSLHDVTLTIGAEEFSFKGVSSADTRRMHRVAVSNRGFSVCSTTKHPSV